jgi:hypothetical protein
MSSSLPPLTLNTSAINNNNNNSTTTSTNPNNNTTQPTTTLPPPIVIPDTTYDFSSLEHDLLELRKDPNAAHALDSGADLTSYNNNVSRELAILVEQSIPEFIREAPETKALHSDIEACDNVLASIEQILLEFQRNLGGISDEIRHLQEGSTEMGIKLRNRRALEIRVRAFLERITVSEGLVRSICDDDVKGPYVETLQKLEEQMAFAHEQNSRVLLKTTQVPGAETITLPVPPCKTLAVEDIQPLLDKLKIRATTKVRQFLLDRISMLKKPSTNVQMMQRDLLRFKYFVGFLQRNSPPVYDEIKSYYIETMRNIVYGLFRTYHGQLLKFTPQKDLGSFDLAVRQRALPGEDLIVTPTKRPDPIILSQRKQEMGTPEAPPLVVHLVQSEKTKLTYEALFRSEQKHLIDSASSEYVFLFEFFASNPSSLKEPPQMKNIRAITADLFMQVFQRTLQMMWDNLDQFLMVTGDAIAILLMIEASQKHLEITHTRRVPVLQRYFDEINMRLWPHLKRIVDANIKSLSITNPAEVKKLMPRPDFHAQFWIRRYALLVGSIYSIGWKLGRNVDNNVFKSLEVMRQRVMALLTSLSNLIPDVKTRHVFMVSNCDEVLAAFHDLEDDVDPKDMEEFQNLMAIHESQYIEEEVSECFAKLVTFVRKTEAQYGESSSGAAGGSISVGTSHPLVTIDEKEAKTILGDFASTWRQGMELINAEVKRYFGRSLTAKSILGKALMQVVLYYNRFLEVLPPGLKSGSSSSKSTSSSSSGGVKLVESKALTVERERFLKMFD